MNELSNILEYLDGEMNPTEERALFLSLAESDSLRSQMRQLYSVNYSLSSNRNYFAPSAGATLGVFNGLGFSGKYLGGNAATGHGAAGWVSANLLNKSALLGAIVSLFITAASYFVIDIATWSNTNGSLTGAVSDAGAVIAENKGPEIKVLPQDTSVTAKQEPAVRYVYLPAGKSDIAQNVNQQPAEPQAKQQETAPVQQTAQTEKPEIQNSETNPIAPEDIKTPDSNPILEDRSRAAADYNIEVEYRGALYRNLPSETIEPARQAHFDNSSITVLYRISDDISIGADLRQERFYQVFDGRTSDGMPAKYIQQPNFTTLNLLVRYCPVEFLGLKPFVQFESGWARSGWINRGAAGLALQIADPIDLVFIGEYSYFIYNNNSKLFGTEKLGLHYGINIKF